MYYETDEKHLYRDGQSSAILNTDNTAYQAYKQHRAALVRQRSLQQEVDSLKTAVADLNNNLNDIKDLLVGLLGRQHNDNTNS